MKQTLNQSNCTIAAVPILDLTVSVNDVWQPRIGVVKAFGACRAWAHLSSTRHSQTSNHNIYRATNIQPYSTQLKLPACFSQCWTFSSGVW